MFRNLIHIFDKLEDRIRHRLSKRPVLYALIGGVCVVLFWRSVWELADMMHLSAFWSLIASVVIMLATGTFVSFFIGEQVLLSGLREEKRIDEKTEDEIEQEDERIARIRVEIDEIRSDVMTIKNAVSPHKKEIKIKREKPAEKVRIRVVKK